MLGCVNAKKSYMPRLNRNLNVTSKFRTCGNCFRFDTYYFCEFGCRYCFANVMQGGVARSGGVADMSEVRENFRKALEEGDTASVRKEFLRRRVPVHLGGMADPFTKSEFEMGLTYEFLEIARRYGYPVNISTKAAYLPSRYYDVVSPDTVTFSLSIMGLSGEYIRDFEANTPLAVDRIAFAKELKDRGFWVGIRIQPVVNMGEVLSLVEKVRFVDYITVEHIKIQETSQANSRIVRMLVDKWSDFHFDRKKRISTVDTAERMRDIKMIQDASEVPVGVGDDGLETLSETLNCCGLDTMPPAFGNWMRYNCMYLMKTGDYKAWTPDGTCNKILELPYKRSYRGYVDEYMDRHYCCSDEKSGQLSLFDT